MFRAWKWVSSLTGGRVYTRVPAKTRAIYITFDDGPDPDHTPRFLDLLGCYDARATFFIQGNRGKRYTNLLEEIVARGHAIGNHSYSHVSFPGLQSAAQIEEIERTDEVLRRFDGKDRHVFRPPYGRLTWRTISLCSRRGQSVALWSHDSMDYCLDAEAIEARLRRIKVRPGDIFLFHDDGDAGLTALERLLPEWQRAGFVFDTL